MERLPRVVYIGGAARSGSTLTERLLGALPGVCVVGELVHLWQRGVVDGNRCGCGDPIPDCPFWQQVAAIAFGGWDEVNVSLVVNLRAAVDRNRFIPWLLAPALRPASFQRALTEYLTYFRRLYAAIATVSGCEVVVDSSKHPSLAFCLGASSDLDLRVIHVVRDSRAVAYSWSRRVKRPEAITPSYMRTIAPAETAWQWSYQNAALQLLAKAGTPTLRVRYEDLATAPESALIRIAGFAGLTAAADQLAFVGADGASRWADLGISHTVSGNPMRFATGRIPIRVDDEWRTAMPTRQRRTVTALTLPLLARYGYANWMNSRGHRI